MFGNVGKLIRLLGGIGLVFTLFSTFHDLDKAKELDPGDQTHYQLYCRIQIGLGILELGLIGGEIFLEMFAGTMAAASWCGPLALGTFNIWLHCNFIGAYDDKLASAVGVIAVIVTVVCKVPFTEVL